ncbi:MAG: chromosome segregation protein SMC [Candidatus Methylomirabilales bacterium]
MHLSNVTLFGFKSFVDRVSIDFQPGVTSLVGPNGCGKSNIIDAMLWVLGEQSPKALRGERMEDLIFAGNAHRKPVGMAEVSLTLSNVQGRLAVPYDEVTIARRLYRSGESEYLLNQNPCRLKDITRLFLDTGLGREPYALIQQGAIGSLLNAKPADRRALLEEAAGTMSYKVNRNTALGRLEAAEHNLLRVKDVLQEIERQRSSLHRQAKKAERYQRMALRLKELHVLLLVREERRLDEELSRIIRQERDVATAQESCQLRVSKEETSLEAGRLHDLQMEKRTTAGQERLYSLRSQRQREEAEVRSRENILQDLTRRREERQEQLRSVAERLHRLLQDFEDDGKRRAATEEDIEVGSRQLRELHEALTSVETDLKQCEAALGGRKKEILTLTERLVSERNHVASLTERQRLLRQERETTDRQLHASRTEAESVTGRDRELTLQLGQLASRIEALTGERKALAEDLANLQAHQEVLGGRRAELREELNRLEGRLGSVRELEEGFAGLSEGQQLLLKGKAAGVKACQTIAGPLSRLIRAEAACERAIEALLGDLQQGLLIPTAADALSLIRYLEQEGTGWATLLPRQGEWLAERQEALHLRKALEDAGASLGPEVAQQIVGLALEFVKGPAELQPLLRGLLGNAVIVRDLPTALTLLRTLPGPVRVATTSGAVLSSRGPIQGGNTIAWSLLSRHRELEELPAVITRVTEELRGVEGEWEKVQEARSHRQQVLSGHEESLKEAEEARHAVERSLAEVRGVAFRLGSQTTFLASELTRLDEELGDLEKALQDAQTKLVASDRQEEVLRQETAEHDRQVTLLQTRRQECEREMAEARIRSTSLQERREALARSLDRLEADLARERTREAEIHQEEEADCSREAGLTREIATLQHSVTLLNQREAEEADAVQELQRERDQLRQALLVQEEALKTARRELAEAQQAQAAIAATRAALDTERSLLHKRLQEEVPEGDALRERLQTEEHLQDPELLAHEGEELRQKMGAMGPINMAALEEYEALSERFRFLTDQAADLTASATSLKASIVEINRTIQERFAKTLAAVSEQLNRFWQRLFGGGEAELVLSDADEVEEPGVEIRVRIPGKRTTTLSLLSGGEKTLGAIALIMALWATNPSPFVVLDEVDAALDDLNVDRFASLIRELGSASQFVIVTHHPRTIETADLLYGITMEEPGVSKLISVRLGERMEQAAAAPVP